MAAHPDSEWIWWPRPRPAATMRLFCFPCAGRGASAFRGWTDRLPASIELCAVQLPGRERRMCERAFTCLDDVTAALCRHLRPHLDRPFAFFGHSMGALLAFELARLLRGHAVPGPEVVAVAGCAAPHVGRRHPPLHGLPDDELTEAIGRLNGTPPEVLANRELMQTMFPLLRADFSVCETYRHRPAPPLSCPILVYGGEQDPDVTRMDLEGWRRHTIAPCRVEMLPGDHFFVYAPESTVVARLTRELHEGRAPLVSVRPGR